MVTVKRVLIANRGEIARRIARAAAALGIEWVNVPDGSPVATYLDASGLVKLAREADCDCVHPGYGFLAESAEFAGLCQAEGIRFIGPPPEALRVFGDKV